MIRNAYDEGDKNCETIMAVALYFATYFKMKKGVNF